MVIYLLVFDFALKSFGLATLLILNLRVVRRFSAANPDLFSFHDAYILQAGWTARILPWTRANKFYRYKNFLKKNLVLIGKNSEFADQEFIATQIVLSLFLLCLVTLFSVVTFSWQPMLFFLAVFAGCFYPFLQLTDQSRKVLVSCHRDLPFLLDYLSLAMGAGLEMTQALEVVIADSSASPMRDHFDIVFKQIKLGKSRAEALEDFNTRVDHPGIKIFTQTLIQGLELGTDIVKTISTISETLQQKRFQMAEEMAGKISVRMMVPMMCFIMPSVMIILLAPMILSYIQQG